MNLRRISGSKEWRTSLFTVTNLAHLLLRTKSNENAKNHPSRTLKDVDSAKFYLFHREKKYTYIFQIYMKKHIYSWNFLYIYIFWLFHEFLLFVLIRAGSFGPLCDVLCAKMIPEVICSSNLMYFRTFRHP